MSTEKPQSERCTTSANKESDREATGQWIEPHESITDHTTRALRQPSADQGDGLDRGTTFLYYRGPFRVYFNRKEEWPRVVSIDNGSHAWEVVCKSVEIKGVALKSFTKASAEYPEPIFALQGTGAVYVDGNGHAVIR